jgi:hypothetical protein
MSSAADLIRASVAHLKGQDAQTGVGDPQRGPSTWMPDACFKETADLFMA